jgi:DNA-binding PucR family transcriptional regulator
VIEPQRALRDVRKNLRDEVMPELRTAHARAVLGAALGIIDEVVDRIRLDERPAELTVAEMQPALAGWERTLAGRSPAAAEAVAAHRRQAEEQTDVSEARIAILGAAERVVEAAWSDLEPDERDRILTEVRQLVRADTNRQRGD